MILRILGVGWLGVALSQPDVGVSLLAVFACMAMFVASSVIERLDAIVAALRGKPE